MGSSVPASSGQAPQSRPSIYTSSRQAPRTCSSDPAFYRQSSQLSSSNPTSIATASQTTFTAQASRTSTSNPTSSGLVSRTRPSKHTSPGQPEVSGMSSSKPTSFKQASQEGYPDPASQASSASTASITSAYRTNAPPFETESCKSSSYYNSLSYYCINSSKGLFDHSIHRTTLTASHRNRYIFGGRASSIGTHRTRTRKSKMALGKPYISDPVSAAKLASTGTG
jgi:hypothetical protein